jgi:hypothetical protein
MSFSVDFAVFFENDRRPVEIWYAKNSDNNGLPTVS